MNIMIAAGRGTMLCEHSSQSSRAPGHGWSGRRPSIACSEAMDGRASQREVRS